MQNIWALFSVANLYDQPSNNLVAWWPDKPSFAELAKALGTEFPCHTDEETLFVINIWKGSETLDKNEQARYRLRPVPSNTQLGTR
jgi:hypothetical protein